MSDATFSAERLLEALSPKPEELRVLSTARRVLDAVYGCSLHREEGRELRFNLLVAESVPEDDEFDLLRLESPIPITASTLRRLAPATTPKSLFIADASGETPHIVGLGQLTSVSHLIRALGQRRPMLIYEVSCEGAGIIEVSLNGRMARFNREVYARRDIRNAVSPCVTQPAVSALVNRIVFPGILGWINYSRGRSVGITHPRLFGRHRDTMQQEAPAIARSALVEYLIELVDCIRSTRAGGALLILPNTDAPARVAGVTGWSVRRDHERYRGELWNAGVLNSFEWLVHLRLAQLGKVVAPERIDPPDDYERAEPDAEEWIHSTGFPGVREAARVQREDAERVAHLTAIDGAVVMTAMLSPVVFGAKFSSVDVTGLPPRVLQAVAERGMRHRSMAATVGAISDSSGIVVSQDGDATVFVNSGGYTCCHHEDVPLNARSLEGCKHTDLPQPLRPSSLVLEILKDEERRRALAGSAQDSGSDAPAD